MAQLALLFCAPAGQTNHELMKFYELPQRGSELSQEKFMEDVEENPWVPCQKGKVETGGITRGFCRLDCVTQWAYAPHRMPCPMLETAPLIGRAFGVESSTYREWSENSMSKVRACHTDAQALHASDAWGRGACAQVNSGKSDPNDPDVRSARSPLGPFPLLRLLFAFALTRRGFLRACGRSARASRVPNTRTRSVAGDSQLWRAPPHRPRTQGSSTPSEQPRQPSPLPMREPSGLCCPCRGRSA